MSLGQADQERLEEANVRLGGAVDDLRDARAVLADSSQTAIRRAHAQGEITAITQILWRKFGIQI